MSVFPEDVGGGEILRSFEDSRIFIPGKRGVLKTSSAMTQPMAHISIPTEY
jgi:hypothetical protein